MRSTTQRKPFIVDLSVSCLFATCAHGADVVVDWNNVLLDTIRSVHGLS